MIRHPDRRGPDLHGRLVRRALLPLEEWRTGRRALPRLRELEESQRWSPDRLHELRLRKLRALLDRAFRHTAFYRERFREAGIAPGDIRDLDDLRKLPPLTKGDLKGRLEDLVADDVPPGARHRSATGGSTGEHTPFYRDDRCLGPKLAVQYRFMRWAGWEVGDRVALVWPALQDFAGADRLRARARAWLVDRQLVLPAGKLDGPALDGMARRLRAFAPALIRAFPNPLSVLARHLRDRGEAGIRPRGVITVGEPLLEGQRALFEEVFGCPVFNCYVGRECGHLASECEAHRGLHVAAESVILEFERDGRPAAPGEPGEILITDLENAGMPFIRYRVGDVGTAQAGACACGRTLPLMGMEAGRVSDFVVSPVDGALVSGASLCHHLIAEGPRMGQVQLVQDARDHLTIRVVRGEEDLREGLDHFERVIGRLFGGRLRVSFEFVEAIPRERSGKYRFCVNQVAPSA